MATCLIEFPVSIGDAVRIDDGEAWEVIGLQVDSRGSHTAMLMRGDKVVLRDCWILKERTK